MYIQHASRYFQGTGKTDVQLKTSREMNLNC